MRRAAATTGRHAHSERSIGSSRGFYGGLPGSTRPLCRLDGGACGSLAVMRQAETAEPAPRMSSSEEDGWGEGRGLLQRTERTEGAAAPSLDALLDEIGLGRWNIGVVVICGLGNAADAVEAMCMGYILPELPDVGAAQRGFLTSAIFIGMLFGGLVCGSICDRYGRRPCLLVSLGTTFVFGLMSATMPTWSGVAFCRVAAGFGVGGAVPATFTLGIEMVSAHKR